MPTLATERRNRVLRSAGLMAITLFVVAGLLGAFGVRAGRVSARSEGGLEVELTYPHRARPGLAVPFEVRITSPGGFDGQVEVAMTTSYLQMFDENGSEPEPVESTVDGEHTVWTFDPPDSDTLVVWLDNRIEPGVQWRRRGTTTVRVGDQAATLRYTTWVLP